MEEFFDYYYLVRKVLSVGSSSPHDHITSRYEQGVSVTVTVSREPALRVGQRHFRNFVLTSKNYDGKWSRSVFSLSVHYRSSSLIHSLPIRVITLIQETRLFFYSYYYYGTHHINILFCVIIC